MKENLSEKDYILINSYLDGELTQDQEIQFNRRIEDSDFKLELESYKQFRIHARIWFEEKAKSSKKVDLWEKINSEITISFIKKNIFQETFNKISSTINFNLFSPSSAALAFSVILVTLYFNTNRSNKNITLASKDLYQISSDNLEHSNALKDEEVTNTANQSNNQVIANLNIDDLLLDNEVNQQLIRSLSVNMIKPENSLASNSAEMRVNGADVKWIHTEDPFKMLSVKNSNNPPVIFVATRR